MAQISDSKIIGDIGELIFAIEVMHKTKWIPDWSQTLDQAGIDLVFRKRIAEIQVQVKTATFRKGQKNWTLTPYRAEKGLNKELYGQPNFFLGIVLFHCERDEFFSFKTMFSIGREIMMVPGMRVIKYFELKTSKSHNITISLKKLYEGGYDIIRETLEIEGARGWLKNGWREHKWLEGAYNLKKMFATEFEKRTRKRKRFKRANFFERMGMD